MTVQFLESYRSRLRQLEIMREQLHLSYINGIDTTRVSVQSGRTGNSTAEFALREIELAKSLEKEYLQIAADVKAIQDYIFNMDDPECKEIAMRRCLKGETYEQIGEAMFMHRTTALRKLQKYIAHNATN